MRNNKGFTLVEVMIVVLIIAIIAAIAFPSYQDSVRKARRADAKTALLNAAQLLERCFTEFNTYLGPPPPNGCDILTDSDADGTGDTINLTSDAAPLNGDGFYTITTNPGAETLQANSYTLTATPRSQGGQDQDTRCATFTLDQAGVKGATNTDCW